MADPDKIAWAVHLRDIDQLTIAQIAAKTGITRPPVLTDEAATGHVRVLTADSGQMADAITRADLATFIITQMDGEEHLRQAVTITNS